MKGLDFEMQVFNIVGSAVSVLSSTAQFYLFIGFIYLNHHIGDSKCCLKNFWDIVDSL